MQYEIYGTSMPVVECKLMQGETLQCQAGAMKYMDADVEMKTGVQGGLGGFVKRRMMGEKGFLNFYSATRSGQRVALGHTYPGKIVPVDVGTVDYICQKRAFLAAESDVELDIVFQKKLGAGFFGGEGFIMQKLKGRGTAFLEIDGETVEMQLAAGEKIKVETGALAFMESTVGFDVEMVKGMSNFLFGGEGLFLTTLTGPGKIWLQTMSIQTLAGELYPYLPSSKKN
ncbi:MAG: TIGR00266 family protein [Spirochaetaceae bacterium]|nr:MAG: TIGR00266 family protein [Spirochaetaceae bacterium]